MKEDLLLKLADHLERGHLSVDLFDFSLFHGDASSGVHVDKFDCGTAGCALGECPAIFPDQWVFMGSFPVLTVNGVLRRNTRRSAMQFFDITEDAYEHLFIPSQQNPELFGGSVLTCRATKEQVAANIRAFVEL